MDLMQLEWIILDLLMKYDYVVTYIKSLVSYIYSHIIDFNHHNM
jgi:hypothetical protein